jgi:hypothetical protein
MIMKIQMTQDDIDEISTMTEAEISTMTEAQDIKDYLSVLILMELDSDPLEAMSPIYTNHEVLH